MVYWKWILDIWCLFYIWNQKVLYKNLEFSNVFYIMTTFIDVFNKQSKLA